MRQRVTIDGSAGEGGGQILRTSLALSIITGKPFEMTKIRAGRAKPGLRRQHVACVDAAAQLCDANADGGRVDSARLVFEPSDHTAETLEIDIGSAGSTSLVVQTILMPMLVARRAARAIIKGGTHNPMAPSFEFLDRVFLPQLHAMGADVSIECKREGFVPTGGGRVDVTVGRGEELSAIEIVDAGPVMAYRAMAIVSGIPAHVADRELAVVTEAYPGAKCTVRELNRGGPANLVLIEAERSSGHRMIRELVTMHGEKHLRAEVVAQRACTELDAYLEHGHPVGEHLADQLLLPMALAGGGRFRTGPLSLHATTNIETIRLFLDIEIVVTEIDRGVEVAIG